MNTRTSSILILAAALLGSTAVASASGIPQDSGAIGYWASKITVTSWNDLLDRTESRAIVAGTDQGQVVSALGQPALELSPDVWVYDNCRPDEPDAQARGCNILVVAFANGKVDNLKFVNQVAARVIAARLKSGHPERYASAG